MWHRYLLRTIKEYQIMDKDEMWEKLLQMGVSEETLQIVTDINGYSEETMCDILYAAFGDSDFNNLTCEM